MPGTFVGPDLHKPNVMYYGWAFRRGNTKLFRDQIQKTCGTKRFWRAIASNSFFALGVCRGLCLWGADQAPIPTSQSHPHLLALFHLHPLHNRQQNAEPTQDSAEDLPLVFDRERWLSGD
jgi:hypothetical protein